MVHPDSKPPPSSTVDGLALMREGWRLADVQLDNEVGAARALERPIQLRHPFVFYLGHLGAFGRNTALRASGVRVVPEPQCHPFDYIFARGVDPDVENPAKCHAHPDVPSEWPAWGDVVRYRDRIREELTGGKLADYTCRVIAEHDFMHVETLYYMMAQASRDGTSNGHQSGNQDIDETRKPASQGAVASVAHILHAKSYNPLSTIKWITVPAGCATLGRANPNSATAVDAVDGGAASDKSIARFGWDNEFGRETVPVPEFSISQLPVTASEYLKFVECGGYSQDEFWCEIDWMWIVRERVRHPLSWHPRDGAPHPGAHGPSAWSITTVDGLVSMEDALDWPVSVSLAEARAYASYAHARLPTEAEWDRAAYGDDANPNAMPWGGSTPVPGLHGNFGFYCRRPVSVGSFPTGKSWVGVLDMVGNGWELTDSIFEPLVGFEPMALYPQYSVDFFDGKHFVVKGASWSTHSCMVRRTFRNYYQAHYPYVFSKFRLVKV
jgi:gamma-glutamyl hercynylcysteine S-oxide synthase